jgi:hypothetical protein
MWDENTGQFCDNSSPACSPSPGTGGFNGSTAEFIFEKQGDYLPDYWCCAIMRNAGAKDSYGSWHDFSTDSVDLFELYGFGTGSFKQLEFVNMTPPQQVQFSFNERSGGH